jgi:hypothetical protein
MRIFIYILLAVITSALSTKAAFYLSLTYGKDYNPDNTIIHGYANVIEPVITNFNSEKYDFVISLYESPILTNLERLGLYDPGSSELRLNASSMYKNLEINLGFVTLRYKTEEGELLFFLKPDSGKNDELLFQTLANITERYGINEVKPMTKVNISDQPNGLEEAEDEILKKAKKEGFIDKALEKGKSIVNFIFHKKKPHEHKRITNYPDYEDTQTQDSYSDVGNSSDDGITVGNYTDDEESVYDGDIE